MVFTVIALVFIFLPFINYGVQLTGKDNIIKNVSNFQNISNLFFIIDIKYNYFFYHIIFFIRFKKLYNFDFFIFIYHRWHYLKLYIHINLNFNI